MIKRILLLVVIAFSIVSCEDVDPIKITTPIVLDCDHFETSQTLVDDPDRPVDYRIECLMDVEAALKIMPGVVIEFAENAGIRVRDNGSMNAVGGTEEARIIFTGVNTSNGSWRGIMFDSFNTQNQLENCIIDYAGGQAFNSNDDHGSIVIWADARVRINNCLIRNSGSFGITATYNGSDWSASNNTISNCNEAPIIMEPIYLGSLDGTNLLSGNNDDHIIIEIYTHPIEESTTWSKSSVPYKIRSINTYYTNILISSGAVNIEPGTKIVFEDGTGIKILESASLTAVGTIAEPIEFTSSSQVAGAWAGINYHFTQSPNNQIKHASISYAGSEGDHGKGGVLMWATPRVDLQDVVFNNIPACSVMHLTGDEKDSNLTYSNLTHNNTEGEICF